MLLEVPTRQGTRGRLQATCLCPQPCLCPPTCCRPPAPAYIRFNSLTSLHTGSLHAAVPHAPYPLTRTPRPPSPPPHTFHQLLVDAYEVLCDVLLRRTYDKMGPGALTHPRFHALREYLGSGRGSPGGPAGGAGRAQGHGQGQGPAAGRASEARRGRDVHTVLGLMLSEAAAGVDKTVTYTAHAVCEDCKVGNALIEGAHAGVGRVKWGLSRKANG